MCLFWTFQIIRVLLCLAVSLSIMLLRFFRYFLSVLPCFPFSVLFRVFFPSLPPLPSVSMVPFLLHQALGLYGSARRLVGPWGGGREAASWTRRRPTSLPPAWVGSERPYSGLRGPRFYTAAGRAADCSKVLTLFIFCLFREFGE